MWWRALPQIINGSPTETTPTLWIGEEAQVALSLGGSIVQPTLLIGGEGAGGSEPGRQQHRPAHPIRGGVGRWL